MKYSITVSSNGTWKLFVHGQVVSNSCKCIASVPACLHLCDLNALIAHLESLFVCPGHPDDRFVTMIKSKKGKEIKGCSGSLSAVLDDYCEIEYEGNVYNCTVRPSKCELLTELPRCSSCVAYRSTLRAMHSRWVKDVASPRRLHRRSNVSSHSNYRYLRTPEALARMSNLKHCADAALRKVEHLKSKLAETECNDSIEIDEQLERDLKEILSEKDSFVKETYPVNSFEYLFWEQQKEVHLKSDQRAMRWHPMIIKWCLNLKYISSSAYNALRSSGILKLPSERTLRDYSNWVKAKVGFQHEVDNQLKEEANLEKCLEFKKCICLVWDEVRIKQGLVYDKSSCKLIGFTDLDAIGNHLKSFEQQISTGKTTHPIATNMQVFMVRGLFSGLEFPYAQFPVDNLSGCTIACLVDECICHLESLGFKVLALCCDGASCNRKCLKILGYPDSEGFVFKAHNVYADEERPIFLFSDPPHLIKTVRNCWANSYGHKFIRKLYVSFKNKKKFKKRIILYFNPRLMVKLSAGKHW